MFDSVYVRCHKDFKGFKGVYMVLRGLLLSVGFNLVELAVSGPQQLE